MQKKTRPASVAEILSRPSGPLRTLYSRSLDTEKLQEKLQAHLPGTLREHIVAVSYHNSTLHLYTDNAAWATRLRFQRAEILSLARDECLLTDLQGIRIRIAPTQDPPSTARRSCRLSANSARLLEDTARAIADPALRAALLRLSGNRNN